MVPVYKAVNSALATPPQGAARNFNPIHAFETCRKEMANISTQSVSVSYPRRFSLILDQVEKGFFIQDEKKKGDAGLLVRAGAAILSVTGWRFAFALKNARSEKGNHAARKVVVDVYLVGGLFTRGSHTDFKLVLT